MQFQLPNKRFLNKPCHRCGNGKYTYTEDQNDWWVECDYCHALLFCYVPMPHQYVFHQDHHKFKLYAGGYGSAKTSTCGAEVMQHALSTPKGRTLVGAQTYVQLEETAKKQILEMTPAVLIEDYQKQKNVLILKNGHEILFRSFDDETKLRSLNLTMFWIEEASTVNYEIFVQLQTRLRNHATQNHKGILSTNPDINWVRSEFLLKSDLIVGAKESYNIDPLDRNKDYATFIASTDRNIYLPKDYIQSIIKGKPEYWVNRYIYASFSIAEGMVYPMFMEHVVPAFNIQDKIKNEGWETIHGVDFGILDPTVLISAAIDPNTGVVYVYDEYYKRNQSVPYHAQEMKKRLEWIPLGNIIRIMADPAGARRGQSDRRSLFDHYSEYGLYFKAGDNRIETGIAKVYAYFAAGKLKIFDTCRNLIEEGINYRYKPQELDSEKNPDEKPIDKDNHGLDALRYMIQELPDDPYALKDRAYHYTQQQKKEDQLPYALQDDDYNLYDSKESWYYYY